jgi:NDP-sugar pyrophosphorylase family protein
MLNIIVPIASKKLLDDNEKFHYPLPLIELNGKLLIEYSLERLQNIKEEINFIFILSDEDCEKYHFDNTIKLLIPNSVIHKTKTQTRGSICSILLAIDKIDTRAELIIVNFDQIIDYDLNTILNYFRISKSDAGLITFNSVHPRWSFAKISNGKVIQTEEKNPISNTAIAGFYYFNKTTDFILNAFEVIKNNASINGNFYTSMVYNYLILNNKQVDSFEIEKSKYFSFYSSQKVKEFEIFLNYK